MLYCCINNNNGLFFEKIVNFKVLNDIFESYKKENNIKKSKYDILLDGFKLNTIIMAILTTSIISYLSYKNNITLFIPFFVFLSYVLNVYYNTRVQIRNGIKKFMKECCSNRPHSMDNLLIYTKGLIASSEKEAILKNNNNDIVKKKRL